MPQYVVAYCQLHTGTLDQHVVTANNEYDAVAGVLSLDEELKEGHPTLDDLHELSNNWDSFISVIEI
jgi:hypothetical protein